MKLLMENWQEYLEEEEILMEKCWAGYEKKGMKKMFGKMYPNCVKKKKKKKKKKRKNRKRNEEVEIHGLYGEEKNPRIPRKKGQPAKSKKHSDLYTDEDPKGTIHGLGYKDESTARASVTKIRNSGRSHAHKTQAAIAMEQRAKAAGKSKEAAIFRKFIERQKKKTKAKAKKK